MAGVRVVVVNQRGEVCCVRHAYGVRDWNVPGGGIEQGESPLVAAYREVLEETGLHVRIEAFVGLYSVPVSSDLIALFAAKAESQVDAVSVPNAEIAEVRFFRPSTFPAPMHPCVTRGLEDALAGRRGLVRVLNPDGTIQAALDPGT